MIAFEDLRFVAALSRTGSLSAAARALDVTPPALSMRLKKLEAVLRVNLVVRNSRGLSFTPEGEQLVHEAQSLLARVDGLADNLTGGVFAGPLRVVAPFGFGRIHVAPVMAVFIREHPSACDIASFRSALEQQCRGRRRHPYWSSPGFLVGCSSSCPQRALGMRQSQLSSTTRNAVTPSRAGAACLSLRSRKRRGRDAVALQKQPHIIPAIRGASNKSGTNKQQWRSCSRVGRCGVGRRAQVRMGRGTICQTRRTASAVC